MTESTYIVKKNDMQLQTGTHNNCKGDIYSHGISPQWVYTQAFQRGKEPPVHSFTAFCLCVRECKDYIFTLNLWHFKCDFVF